MIGEDVELVLMSVQGNQVRLGIEAPKDVAVHRKEIYERIKRQERGGNVDDNT